MSTPSSATSGGAAAADLPVLRIEPSKGWVSLRLGELWAYRELLYFLTWRDIKVRYKQTALGASWAIIQPFLTMVVFSLFFGRLAGVPSDGLPYPIFSFAALVPWTFFANGLTQSSNSLVGSANLIKKVYFPRLAIPIATILSGVVDFCLAFLVLVGMMFFYGVLPTVHIVWLPLFLVLAMVTSLGVGLWLTALNVHYRDIRYIVPFLVQIWMFATPIAYSSSLLDKYPGWQTAYGLNPMVGVVEGFRWALLSGASQEETKRAETVQVQLQPLADQIVARNLSGQEMQRLAQAASQMIPKTASFGKVSQRLKAAVQHLEAGLQVRAAQELVAAAEDLKKRAQQNLKPPGPMVATSAVAAVIILITGAFYFRRMEKNFADVV